MRSRNPMFGRNMTLLALQKPGAANYFSILRPNTGESFFDMEVCAPHSSHTLLAILHQKGQNALPNLGRLYTVVTVSTRRVTARCLVM